MWKWCASGHLPKITVDLLIKSNPVVFLLVAKGSVVCNFKSSVGEILASFHLFY